MHSQGSAVPRSNIGRKYRNSRFYDLGEVAHRAFGVYSTNIRPLRVRGVGGLALLPTFDLSEVE